MSASLQQTSPFQTRFSRWARRVRRRLLARQVLTGVAIGLVAGSAVAALLWWFRFDTLRPWAAGVGGLGGLAGLALGLRRRWSDTDVALFLDARLQGQERISTAVELAGANTDPAQAVVIDQASTILANGDSTRARPRVLRLGHAIALVGAAMVAWLSVLPLPPAPAPPPPAPGAELVQEANLAGLDRIIALERLDARDAEQRRRLDAIAQQARKLRADLAKGMERREAQARIAKLRDELAAERLRFGNRENRAGLAAAVRKLQSDPHLKDAADALGNGDLTEFDREMQELANQAEAEAREAAKKALENAEDAARKRGAQELAELLERQRVEFEQQEARAEALRELARQLEGHLSDEARQDLEEFGSSGDPEAQRRLAEALEDALQDLSEQERQRLSERLGQELEDGQLDPLTKEQLEKLQDQLESPEGREQLKQMLKDLANRDPSEDARRQQGLDDAERGGADAQRQLGLVPVPRPAAPQSGSDQGQPSTGSDSSHDGAPGEGGDEGDHDGKTDRVDQGQLRAKANAKLDPSVPLRSGTLGRVSGGTGDTANQQGTGALGRVGAAEMDAVERSEVPEEYREQVGRYFQP